MIAIDTNVLVRFLADVDSVEGPAARRYMTETLTNDAPGFISVVVLAELLWVLDRGYQLAVEEQRGVVHQLLKMPQLVVQQADIIERALRLPHRDIADCILHEVGQAVGCSHTATFDQRFARLDKVELVE